MIECFAYIPRKLLVKGIFYFPAVVASNGSFSPSDRLRGILDGLLKPGSTTYNVEQTPKTPNIVPPIDLYPYIPATLAAT